HGAAVDRVLDDVQARVRVGAAERDRVVVLDRRAGRGGRVRGRDVVDLDRLVAPGGLVARDVLRVGAQLVRARAADDRGEDAGRAFLDRPTVDRIEHLRHARDAVGAAQHHRVLRPPPRRARGRRRVVRGGAVDLQVVGLVAGDVARVVVYAGD